MKFLKVRHVFAAIAIASTAPAYASLIQVPGTQVPGTGLGAVSTLATVQDNSLPSNSGNSNGIESGCVTYAGSLTTPSFACSNGLQGGDNQAINRLYLGSSITGLSSAGNIGLVVNVSEPTPSSSVVLTNLYLSLYNLQSNTQTSFLYDGGPLTLSDSGGIGQSGNNLFRLDAAQAAAANTFCPTLSQCVIGGGLQFAAGTTAGAPETLYITALTGTTPGGGGGNGGEVPEPVSLALLGLGLAGIGLARRRG